MLSAVRRHLGPEWLQVVIKFAAHKPANISPAGTPQMSNWDKAWEFGKGFGAGLFTYTPKAIEGAWSFVQDPWGSFKQSIDETRAWNTKYHALDPKFGAFCMMTGLCQAYEDWQAGRYFESGEGTSHFAIDVAVTARRTR